MGWYGGSGGAAAGAWTVEGNPTSATAPPVAFTIGSLTAKATPAGTDQFILQDNAASGALKSVPWSSLPSGAGASIGGTIAGGTAGSVLFINPTATLAQDNAKFFWDDSAFVLKAGTALQQLVNGSFVNALFPIYNASGNTWNIGGGTTSTSQGQNVAIGDQAGTTITDASGSILIGFQAGHLGHHYSSCVAIGQGALYSLDTYDANNVAIGTQSLLNLTSGAYNMSIGAQSMLNVATGNDCLAIGRASLANGFGGAASLSQSVALGSSALGHLGGTASGNIGIGYQAGLNVTGGSNNTLIGGWVGPASAGSISSVIALSDGAGNLLLDYNYTGSSQWSIKNSTNAQSLAVYNTWSSAGANYERAIFDWQTTSNVLTIGTQASGTGVARNLQFVVGGTRKGDYGITTPNWTLIDAAGTTYDLYHDASANCFLLGAGNTTAFGAGAFSCMGMGTGSLAAVTTASSAVAIGVNAAQAATSAGSLVAIGTNALAAATTNGASVAIGVNALNKNLDGSGTAVGYFALSNITGGWNNTAVGSAAGTNITGTSGNNTLLGNWTGPSASVNGVIALSTGDGNLRLDYNYTGSGFQCWTFEGTATIAFGVNTYFGADTRAPSSIINSFNIQNGSFAGFFALYNTCIGANWERAVLDWQTTTNVLTIGTQASGTGVARNMQFAIGGTNKLDYGVTTASVWSALAEFDLIAGTTSIAPLKFKSGTNLTTATAGACEFDGAVFYQTAVASARQVVNCEQVLAQNATRTFVSNTSAQAIFNATANGAISLVANTTYAFEMSVLVSSLSSSAHQLSTSFGGTATLTSIAYQFFTVAATPPAALNGGSAATAASTTVTPSGTVTTSTIYLRGIVRVNAAGTFIPQLTQTGTSAAAIVGVNSFFRCWPIGSGSVTNIGNWS